MGSISATSVFDHASRTTLLVKYLAESQQLPQVTAMRRAGLLANDVTRPVFFTGQRGFVADSTSDQMALNLADEDDFKAHQRRRGLDLVIGAAAPSHLAGGYTIPLTRRLEAPGRLFAGIVMTTVDPLALATDCGKTEAADTAEGVVGLDGIYHSRIVGGKVSFGDKVDVAALERQARAVQASRLPQPSPVDGVERFVAVARVDRYPMLAVVARNADTALAGYRHARATTLAWATAIAALVLPAGGVLWVKARALARSDARLAQMTEHLQRVNREQEAMLDSELVGITRLKNRVGVWNNRALGRMFGHEAGELDGRPSRQLYRDDESYAALGAAAYPMLAQRGHYRTQLLMRHKSGRPIWVDMSGARLSRESGESMWMMLDITPMKLQQERIERAAAHDALTDLPNRALLMDRLRQAIPLSQRMNTQLAVCFIDLDGFKAVNDSLGHAAGDALLQVLAQRLQQCVRGNDTVARLGGDEFVLVLTQLHSRDECDAVIARVQAAVREPIAVGADRTVSVGLSIGVALCPEHAAEAEQLLKLADEAMYRVKHEGRTKAASA